MFCGKCGADVPATSKFCTKCGAPMGNAANASAAAPATPHQVAHSYTGASAVTVVSAVQSSLKPRAWYAFASVLIIGLIPLIFLNSDDFSIYDLFDFDEDVFVKTAFYLCLIIIVPFAICLLAKTIAFAGTGKIGRFCTNTVFIPFALSYLPIFTTLVFYVLFTGLIYNGTIEISGMDTDTFKLIFNITDAVLSVVYGVVAYSVCASHLQRVTKLQRYINDNLIF